jgi:hypothetical protein
MLSNGEKAVLQTDDGHEIRLAGDHTWSFAKRVSKDVRDSIGQFPPEQYINQITNDWVPYVNMIATLHGLTVVDVLPYPVYDAGTIF